ncbi:ABC transporter permease [Streptococcus acidominimus]|uniref:FtsX-like permease family protein n=1 Tax=Streptococcus acidominimus TaxID=1326 RepID=A0A4Y9FL33_STRAI|nr:FtsX-like permease family protein [Streptococcus acidominimus]MBF0819422.1 FtsX-like permease family protein [Streptococcus acidominimus]MBF0838899.1 FtsX-like permease family protein [Streptococcus acidominimus]MBF0847392.1 FtsX-like permease family protein [Streptococcus danieliae]TFU29897.1 FtsX-like permease family protein [Streptococcus acidominimus]
MFYLKLAYGNIRKSLQTFAPFILASLVLFILNCSTLLLISSPMAQSMGTGALALGLGTVVLTIFSLIMEIYSFNFLMKQRAREFGLYNMLGMNKKKLALVATLELMMVFGLVVIFGSILSAAFSNLLYLIFVNLVQGTNLHFEISFVAFFINILIFAVIFFLLELLAIHRVGFSSPLILFRNKEEGEKEPKGNWLLAMLGLVCLGIGYYLSISSSQISAVVVLYRFFIAVLFVIVGTYLFYISFMAWYLKRRRNQKKYFYTPEHFISTSQMIFRMKQHATGLANITLLAVMAFVTIATTTSLYTNMTSMMDTLFPRDSTINYYVKNRQEGEAVFQKTVLDTYPERAKDSLPYLLLSETIFYNGGKTLSLNKDSLNTFLVNDVLYLQIATQDDVKKFGNALPDLQEQEVIFYQPNQSNRLETLYLGEKKFVALQGDQKIQIPDLLNTYNPALLVVSNDQVLEEFFQFFKESKAEAYDRFMTYKVQTDLSKEQYQTLVGASSGDFLTEDGSGILGTVTQKEDIQSDILGFFGGFLFTGFLLGISFLLGAALIIYYKQYSEGYEDKKSYKILQEVGMGQTDVKKTINSQILLVFFMPLAMATLHFIVSLVMLKQMLLIFGVTSHTMIYTVSAITIAIICLIYFGIYKWTSRTYYRIIER